MYAIVLGVSSLPAVAVLSVLLLSVRDWAYARTYRLMGRR